MEIKRFVQSTATSYKESSQNSVESSVKKEIKLGVAKTERDLFEPVKHSASVTKDSASASASVTALADTEFIPFVGPPIGSALAAVAAVVAIIGQIEAKQVEDQVEKMEVEAFRNEASQEPFKFDYALETEVTKYDPD